MPDRNVNLKLTPGEILIVAGALVVLIFSFLHFYTLPVSGGISAWHSGLVPITTLIVLFTLVQGIHIVLTKVLNVDLGPGLLGLTWAQVHLALGFFAAVDSFAFLLVDKQGFGTGIGLIFMLIGSVACFVGAILLRTEQPAT